MTPDDQLRADLDGMRDAHRRLVSRLAALADGDVDGPSRLPAR
jgi:hypothetical protein